jgi:hypothetical protein
MVCFIFHYDKCTKDGASVPYERKMSILAQADTTKET